MLLFKISHGKRGFPQVRMECLEIARLHDFAPNAPGLHGALSGPKAPSGSTNLLLEIPAYGPEFNLYLT